MPEKKNPYQNWSLSRLEKHRSQIDEAVVEKRAQVWAELLASDDRFGSDYFSRLHSESPCRVVLINLGDRDVVYSQTTKASFKMNDFALECQEHKVKSKKWSE